MTSVLIFPLTFTEISVHNGIPGLMCEVFSLKSLQNAAIWICIWGWKMYDAGIYNYGC